MKKIPRQKLINDPDMASWAVVNFLKNAALRSKYWHTMNEIQVGTGMSFATVKNATFALATTGLIEIRDSDVDNAMFLVSLKKAWRDKK